MPDRGSSARQPLAAPPESRDSLRPWPGLDRLGLIQAIGGRSLPLQQQWGITFIAASVASVLVDAQLATRARDRDRERAAESRERQVEILECLYQAAVLSARVQLDPSATNRARLRTFLDLTALFSAFNHISDAGTIVHLQQH